MVEADSCGSLKYWQFRAKSLAKLRTVVPVRVKDFSKNCQVAQLQSRKYTITSIIDFSGDCVQAKEARNYDLENIDVNRIDSADYNDSAVDDDDIHWSSNNSHINPSPATTSH